MISGKDLSNSLMAGNLPKIVWYSTYHVALIKSWLVQKQTAFGQTVTGKEISDPFMADSLPKTILFTFIHTTVAVKKVNDIIRLQALVDNKKVVVTEATIRDALCLDDAEGVKCLPNEEIFAELARMGYEKPSTKLMFYKAFFSSQVGKGFSGVDTPLFEGMLVEQVVEEGYADENVNAGDIVKGDVCATHGEVPTADEEPSIPSPTPPTPPPQSS
nr:hypothetical protein [Tanacetum cinerariifolium]